MLLESWVTQRFRSRPSVARSTTKSGKDQDNQSENGVLCRRHLVRKVSEGQTIVRVGLRDRSILDPPFGAQPSNIVPRLSSLPSPMILRQGLSHLYVLKSMSCSLTMKLGADQMNRCVGDVQTSWFVAKLVLREKAPERRENQIQSTTNAIWNRPYAWSHSKAME